MYHVEEQPESRYYCAGRFCSMRDQCHRHTSSVHVNEAPFNDYDLIHLRKGLFKPCDYYIDRDHATGVKKSND